MNNKSGKHGKNLPVQNYGKNIQMTYHAKTFVALAKFAYNLRYR